jgi:hypothetical protein
MKIKIGQYYLMTWFGDASLIKVVNVKMSSVNIQVISGHYYIDSNSNPDVFKVTTIHRDHFISANFRLVPENQVELFKIIL